MDLLRAARSWRVVVFTVFLLAILLVYTGVWQLAFVAGLVGGFLGKKGKRDFLLGFVGAAFAWGGHLVYAYAFAPGAALASVFAEILGLGAGFGFVVPVLTLLIGGLSGGFGALVGAYAGQLAFPAAAASANAESGPLKGT